MNYLNKKTSSIYINILPYDMKLLYNYFIIRLLCVIVICFAQCSMGKGAVSVIGCESYLLWSFSKKRNEIPNFEEIDNQY